MIVILTYIKKKIKLSIECDENGHKDIKTEKEEERKKLFKRKI